MWIGSICRCFVTEEGLESRRIGVKGEARPYAFYRETAQNRAEVFRRQVVSGMKLQKYEVVFLSLLALERRLAEQPCLILHCAYTGVSGESHALFCTIGNGQNHAGGPLGAVPGKPYCKR